MESKYKQVLVKFNLSNRITTLYYIEILRSLPHLEGMNILVSPLESMLVMYVIKEDKIEEFKQLIEQTRFEFEIIIP